MKKQEKEKEGKLSVSHISIATKKKRRRKKNQDWVPCTSAVHRRVLFLVFRKKPSFFHTRRRKREIAAAGKKKIYIFWKSGRGLLSLVDGASVVSTFHLLVSLSFFLSFSLSPSSCRSLISPFFGTLKGKFGFEQLFFKLHIIFTNSRRCCSHIKLYFRIKNTLFWWILFPAQKKKGAKVLVLSLFSSSKAHPTSSPLSSASASPRSKKGLKLNTSIFSPLPPCLSFSPASPRPSLPQTYSSISSLSTYSNGSWQKKPRNLLCSQLSDLALPAAAKEQKSADPAPKIGPATLPFPHHNTISFPSSLFFSCTRQFCAASSHPAGEPTFWGRQG